jgi:hypothetical protein
MAYKVNKPISGLSNSVYDGVTPASVVASNVSNSTFFHLEVAEVLDIVLNNSHEYYETPWDIGKIKFRLMQSESGKPEDIPDWAYPMNTSLRKYPVKHELVVIVSFLNKSFYWDILNFFNYVNNNAVPNASNLPIESTTVKIGDYEKVRKSRISNNVKKRDTYLGDKFLNLNSAIGVISAKEGDVILQGRFGNSINLTSNEKTGAPSIKINLKDKDTFAAKQESLTSDTGIWITSEETLEFDKNSPELKDSNNPPKEYEGKQIYIGSGRIILNSKANEIIGFSNKSILFSCNKNFGVNSDSNIVLSSKNETIIESPKVFLGGKNATEPVVLGNKLKEILNRLISTCSKITVSTSAGESSIPLNISDFQQIQSDLNDILSENNKTL